MTALLLTLTLALFHWVGPVPADLGVRSGALSPCVSPAHCARADWAVGFTVLLNAIHLLHGGLFPEI